MKISQNGAVDKVVRIRGLTKDGLQRTLVLTWDEARRLRDWLNRNVPRVR